MTSPGLCVCMCASRCFLKLCNAQWTTQYHISRKPSTYSIEFSYKFFSTKVPHSCLFTQTHDFNWQTIFLVFFGAWREKWKLHSTKLWTDVISFMKLNYSFWRIKLSHAHQKNRQSIHDVEWHVVCDAKTTTNKSSEALECECCIVFVSMNGFR